MLWDFHHTGRDEVAHWRFLDGKEWLVLADGRNGEHHQKGAVAISAACPMCTTTTAWPWRSFIQVEDRTRYWSSADTGGLIS